jgi:hypothetical protein
MPRTKTVGASAERTPYKHALLNAILGKILGASSCLPWLTDNLLIDACAGDGSANIWSERSSPLLFLHHANLCKKPTRVVMIEKTPYEYMKLKKLMEEMDTKKIVQVLHGDYRLEEIARAMGCCHRSTNCFLHIDPNNVNDVGSVEHLYRHALSEYLLMLVTLGCNASGVKRLPLKIRKKWFIHLNYLIGLMRDNHDGCLIRLEKDAAQWAYLVTLPTVWKRHIGSVVQDISRLYWAKGVEMCWYRDDPAAFRAMAEKLFLKIDGSEVR